MDKFVQPSKLPLPNEGGVAGFMVRDVKPEQPLKQSYPKLVTELGMVMEVKLLQHEKQ